MLRLGICSVGSELVSGEIADGNAVWLAQRAGEAGWTVSRIIAVGDDRDEIVATIGWLRERSDLVVVGGGLGPTSDDLTRDAVADAAGVALERRADLVAHLEAVYERLARPMPVDALRQADVPVGATVHDPKGTAAGFSLTVADGRGAEVVHVLPGVPWEYRDLAERVVLPDLTRRAGGAATVLRTVHVAGLGESGVGERLRPVSDALEAARSRPDDVAHGVELSFLATADEVLVRVKSSGADPTDARTRGAAVLDRVIDLLGDAVTSVDERRLEDEVARALVARGLTVATAETFTAGRIAAQLATPAGSSAWLRGGVVAHAPALLVDLLGVDAAALAAAGPAGVDRDLVARLAVEARARAGADVGVAAVGVLEDAEADEARPVGTAMWAVAVGGTVTVEDRFIPAADRDILQARAAAFAIEALRRALVADASAGGAVTP